MIDSPPAMTAPSFSLPTSYRHVSAVTVILSVFVLLALIAIGILLWRVLHKKKKLSQCEDREENMQARLSQCCSKYSERGQAYCEGFGVDLPEPDVTIPVEPGGDIVDEKDEKDDEDDEADSMFVHRQM